MKKYLLISLGLLMLVACGKPKAKDEQPVEVQKKAVRLYQVKIENLSPKITGNGNFVPVREAEHTSTVADVIKVNYKNGDRVKAGSVVVVLSDKTIEANYKSAQANYLRAESDYNKALKFSEAEQRNSYISAQSAMISAKESYEKAKRGAHKEDISIAEANVNTAKQSYEQAKFNFDKYQKLFNEKLISEAEYIQYKTVYTQAKSSLDSAQNNLLTIKRGADIEDIRSLEAQYNLAKSNYELALKNVNEKIWSNNITTYKASYLSAMASYELAKKQYDDLTVVAKIDGVISGLSVKPYEKTTGTGVLFYVIENKNMEISLGLNVSEINKIDMNSKVQISIDELNQNFEGKIVEINPAADATTKKFMIKVGLENNNSLIKKGMYAKINILGTSQNMMVVPKNAIVVKGLYKYVFLNSNGVAKQVKVELGAESDDYQEIITNEIKEGDKIVVDGQYLLQDNDSLEEVK